MRRIEARRKKASALRLRFSQSLVSLRQRLSQAMVRSTTQRLEHKLDAHCRIWSLDGEIRGVLLRPGIEFRHLIHGEVARGTGDGWRRLATRR
jgi:hypothetical protein